MSIFGTYFPAENVMVIVANDLYNTIVVKVVLTMLIVELF